jgi:hypothetical protein
VEGKGVEGMGRVLVVGWIVNVPQERSLGKQEI